MRVRCLTSAIVVAGGLALAACGSPPVVAQARRAVHDATVAILGNHDYGYGWAQLDVAASIERLLRQMGVTVLRNATTDVEGLQVCGLADFWSPEFRDAGEVRVIDPHLPAGSGTHARGAAPALASLDQSRPALVLCHNPDACDQPIWDGVTGWVLSGHTHGGQVKPP